MFGGWEYGGGGTTGDADRGTDPTIRLTNQSGAEANHTFFLVSFLFSLLIKQPLREALASLPLGMMIGESICWHSACIYRGFERNYLSLIAPRPTLFECMVFHIRVT